MSKKSKLLFSLGSVALVATPLVSFVSCGNKETDEQKFERLTNELREAKSKNLSISKISDLVLEWQQAGAKYLEALDKKNDTQKIAEVTEKIRQFAREFGFNPNF